jgi:glucose/arabinose dehydrogenase
MRWIARAGSVARILIVAWAAAGACAAPVAALTLVPVATGLNQPVTITHAGDSRLFVVEKPGRIRIVRADGTVEPTPFLDISGLVSTGSEQGLLGLAFHPQYASNGKFYVDYTDTAGTTVVAGYHVSGNPDIADASSAQTVLTVAQPFANHNGGDITFGPDGYLYIGLGDGGSACDPGDRAQDPTVLLGKLLRIDVDSGAPYAIPPGNPFASSMTARKEIWALGLRNPWRFSFDRSTGALYIGDVGQNRIEEVDFAPAGDPGGHNYGWDCYEGNDPASGSGCSTTATCTPASQFVFPVHQYDHSGGRCSITGGFVYRGSQSPALVGRYFFADFCSGDLYSLTTDGMSASVTSYGQPVAGLSPTTFGEDRDGELYVASINGGIFRIVDATPPPTCSATAAGGCVGAPKSTLSVKRPADASRSQLTWQWANGPAQSQAAFGDPVSGATSYALCVYAGTSAVIIAGGIPGAGGWRPIADRGYRFRDRTAPDGITKARLKGSADDKSKIIVKGGGGGLDLSALPLDTSGGVVVQLVRDDDSACWESVFPPGSVKKNDAARFKAAVR